MVITVADISLNRALQSKKKKKQKTKKTRNLGASEQKETLWKPHEGWPGKRGGRPQAPVISQVGEGSPRLGERGKGLTQQPPASDVL